MVCMYHKYMVKIPCHHKDMACKPTIELWHTLEQCGTITFVYHIDRNITFVYHIDRIITIVYYIDMACLYHKDMVQVTLNGESSAHHC